MNTENEPNQFRRDRGEQTYVLFVYVVYKSHQ
jgi:hypothetical protein